MHYCTSLHLSGKPATSDQRQLSRDSLWFSIRVVPVCSHTRCHANVGRMARIALLRCAAGNGVGLHKMPRVFRGILSPASPGQSRWVCVSERYQNDFFQEFRSSVNSSDGQPGMIPSTNPMFMSAKTLSTIDGGAGAERFWQCVVFPA